MWAFITVFADMNFSSKRITQSFYETMKHKSKEPVIAHLNENKKITKVFIFSHRKQNM